MGMFMESVRIALHALFANKMRSILTMLGIIIGVGAVIAMVAVGMGVRQQVTNSIASLGSNMLIIRPGASLSGGLRGAAGSKTTLKYEDALAIQKKIKEAQYVSPAVHGSGQLVNGNQNWSTGIQGVTPEHMIVRDLKISHGSFFTEKEMTSRSRVAVIGTTVSTNLFGEENPVGKTIRVSNQPFRIIGVLESKGQSSVGQDQDDVVLIPLTTAMDRLLAITYVHMIYVQVTSQEKMAEAQGRIETLLRQRHHIMGAKDNDFQVQNLTSLMNMLSETTTMLALFLGSIAAISLLVGGIGIMNIMFASVMERIKEIGTRLAIGAKRADIVAQFLWEAILISVSGGVVGIGVGVALSTLITHFAGIETIVSPLSVLISFGVSVGVGLIFGLAPARRAARRSPIESLRYE